jgi:CheY-like chemotaxis protein
VTTILLVSACFVAFFIHQKYQDFRQTAQLLRSQQEKIIAETLAQDAAGTARVIAVSRKAAAEMQGEALAAHLAGLLREMKLGQDHGSNLVVLDGAGRVVLMPERGFLHDHRDEILPVLAKAAVGHDAGTGVIPMAEGPSRLRWHGEALADPAWTVFALGDLRRAEKAVATNLNRLRIDLVLETAFMVLVAALVTLVAVRFAYVMARRIHREVSALTGFCRAGLAEEASLCAEDFQFAEFAEIGQASQGMVRQIRDLLAELKGVAIRSTLASQTQSAVLASVSHDLLSRLHGIMGTAQLMQAEESATAEDRQRSIETILASGRAIATMVENVDFTSVLDTERFAPRLAPCSLTRLREQASRILQRAAEARGHHLAWDVAATLPDGIVSDERLLRHILLNLAEIGIYGSTGGPVRIGLQGQVPQGESDPMELTLVVHLAGTTLTPTELDEIRQFPNVSRRHASASLRMAICKRLAELLGGTFESNLDGNGSLACTVRIAVAAVPVTLAVPDAPRGTASAATVAPVKISVLLVEDDPINLEVVERMLQHFGATVATATDGASALVLIQADKPFDLILMDCEMPGMDGYAATREIRRREAGGRRVPVIAVSGYAMPEDEDRCREAGMDGLLAKPVAMDDLRATLAKFAP